MSRRIRSSITHNDDLDNVVPSVQDPNRNPLNRVLTVSDETGHNSDRTKLSGMTSGQRIDPGLAADLRRQAQERQHHDEHKELHTARNRVEIITGIGRRTVDIPVEGVVFTLRTLKKFERTSLAQVWEKIAKIVDGRASFTPVGMTEVKTETLSHALYLIDGISVDVILGTADLDYQEQISARRDLIDEMDDALIDYLFEKHQRLDLETRDGYLPKNAEDAKEVADSTRKSGQDS